MTQPQHPTLAVGAPIFQDSQTAAVAREQGALAAWQRLLVGDPVAALSRVQGDFAIAVQLADGATFLAVDRFAIRTLCWRLDQGQLRYALRADDLLAPSGDGVAQAADNAATADPAIEPQALFDYLYFHTIASPGTVFKGVCRLPPGHCAVFRNGVITVAPYWVPTFTSRPARVSLDVLASEFRGLLKEAVASQLDGHQPACFLSGGTDSSTVAGMIREASGRAPVTYSIGFEADGYDEMEYARLAAKHFKAEHHEYYVTPDDLVRSMPELAAACDQPFGNSSMLPAYFCALKAKQNGAQRMLAGDGGDELFGGNSRYAKQRVFAWYGHLPQPLRSRLIEPLVASKAAMQLPGLKKLASYVEQAMVPMPDRLQIYNLLLRLGVHDVLEPRFLAAVNTQAPLLEQREVWTKAATAYELNQTLAYDWRYTLAEADLPKVRTATQHAGMEVGFPLLDQRLVDFSSTLPASYKLKGMKLRWFFKEALKGFLPEATITKKKQGFGLPYGVWLTRHAGLKAQAEDALSTLSERGFIRPDFTSRLIREKLPEHPGYFGEMIWILSILEFWIRGHAPHFRFAD